MPDSGDYRLYITERFDGLNRLVNAHFETVNGKLESIETEAKLTNSRVTHVEDEVEAVEKKLLEHPISCPHGLKIDKIRDDLEEYRVIKKYPKIAMVIIAIFTVLLLMSAYGTIETLRNTKVNRATEKTIDIIDKNTE